MASPLPEANTQLSLVGICQDDREQEAKLYHEAGRFGFVTLNVRPLRGVMCQKPFEVGDFFKLLATFRPRIDSDYWLSQAEFRVPNRRVVNLLRIQLCFVDLDYYRVDGLRDMRPERLVALLELYCDDNQIPAPSVYLYSGRGLQLKWLLDTPIPQKAIPRWNAVQKRLVALLSAFGADPQARDASRILRLEHTYNQKTGEQVRVINASLKRYGFEELCEWVLPIHRPDLEAYRKHQTLVVVEGKNHNTKGLRRGSGRQLAWDRLNDLRALARLRGGVREGQRMLHLHWQLNFLLLSGATNHRQMWHEAAALAYQIDPGWGYNRREISTLYRKAKAYSSGEKVEFNGREYPPLYTPRNETLMELFGIEADEECELQTIISTATARQRDAARKRASRCRQPRAEYESAAKLLRGQVRALRSEGMKGIEIAKKLGITPARVSQILKN